MIRVGVSPVGWSNDDLPTLGADISFERCLDEASRAGFEGIEMGHKFPRDPPSLRRALSARGLTLVSAWHGTRLLERSVDEELRQVEPALEILRHHDADVLVIAEVTGNVIRDRFVPVSRRPALHPEALRRLGAALTGFADALMARGVRVAFHHHMGTVVESADDIDALVAHTGETVGLTIDTGHATFAGVDPAELVVRHRARIRHVHLKDVRSTVLASARARPTSFIDAIVDGVFTVPGDGDLDFQKVIEALLTEPFEGWLVVEADQDPQRADPFIYARLGHEAVRRLLADPDPNGRRRE